MVFSSLIFLFRFMPIFFICYFLLPMKYKNFCLLIFSLLYYSWGEPKYIILMITSILVDYCISQRIWKEEKNKKRQKLLLSASIIFNLLAFLDGIILPIIHIKILRIIPKIIYFNWFDSLYLFNS